jgi:type IV secretory pathway VirB10-like protein
MKSTMRMLSLALCVLPMYLHAETQKSLERAYPPAQEQNTRSAESIPAGTIIPVSLNSTLRSDKSGSGDAITATVMQDVPLGTGKTLRAGSRLTGHVVEAITPGKGSDEPGI